ncbi:GMC oxidoreductase-domain-containing protein [Mycena metata]|uniref:GMC oxidoreductase-domain-containing protein n=1 Tax=Mycena metata TaxID=1033252 RepID=A0AAD7GZL2_9AGAR|nr:GMC oxidoreductase-domain-containing protein [Mycena metata]
MVYTRGSVDDYNHFAAVTGDSGWTWDCLLSYFLKNENGLRPWTITKRSANSTRLYTNHVLAAAVQLSEDWPFSLNMNSGKPLGARSSFAASYLGPEFIDRPNLYVLLHMQVSKLVNPAHLDRKVQFEGIQFMQGKESHLYLNTVAYKKIGGALFTANTTKEIVLSDGIVGTPTILMYSGIGDEATWANLGIATLLDLPSVGYNTTDQPLFGATAFSTDGPAGSTGNFMSFGMVVLNPVSLEKFWFGRNLSSGFLRPAGGRG